MPIQWSDKLDIGVSRFDEHHQLMVSAINELRREATNGRSDPQHLESSLNELYEVTLTHFSDEEAAMAEIGFPWLAEHKEEHELFCQRVRQMQARLHEGNADIGLELLDYVSNWLLSHIVTVDAAYGVYIRDPKLLLEIGSAGERSSAAPWLRTEQPAKNGGETSEYHCAEVSELETPTHPG